MSNAEILDGEGVGNVRELELALEKLEDGGDNGEVGRAIQKVLGFSSGPLKRNVKAIIGSPATYPLSEEKMDRIKFEVSDAVKVNGSSQMSKVTRLARYVMYSS
jgi:hypothetical protein